MPAGGFITPINPDGPQGIGPIVPITGDSPPASPPAYAARLFDGIDDRLVTAVTTSKGSTDNVSGYCWIKKTTETLGSMFGIVDANTTNVPALRFRSHTTYTGSVPELKLSILAQVPLGDDRVATVQVGPPGTNNWTGVPIFCAFVNDVASNRMRFYWGFTADTVVEIDTSDFTSVYTSKAFIQVGDASTKLNIGAAGREGGSAEDFFEGVIDSVGLEFDTVLTLEQLRDRARCGFGSETYYWPITGTDPEPSITTIIGTTVVAGICDSSEAEEPPASGAFCSRMGMGGMSIGIGMGA